MPNTSRDPIAQIYSFRKDFSYLKYLENQSHVDQIEYNLNKGFKGVRDASNRTNNLLDEGFGKIENVLQDGFSNLDGSLSEIRHELYDLNDTLHDVLVTIETGFQDVATELCGINQTLEELLSVAKSPEQTWAYEQYSVALDLFEKGYFEDVTAILDRAINGDKNRVGFKYDYRFYMLRGLVHLGGRGSGGIEFVNLDQAKIDFNTAGKYAIAGPSERNVFLARSLDSARAKAYGLNAWANYCSGDFEIAAHTYNNCIQISPNSGEYRYYHAKALLRTGEIPKAIAEVN